MKKIILLLLVSLSLISTLSAQTVSEEELRSIEDRKGEIIFENYVGPVTDFNTREEIRGIGSFLASKEGSEVSWGNKYKIVRSFQPEIPEGLDADILFILPDAGVDHIRNLRFILSAYLQNTFGYSGGNADVLAEFITYYNAVYYKNIDHFRAGYKEGVVSHLSASSAGLSTHYSEWPGKSRIVIPLKSDKGSLESSLDTSSISGKEVIEEMQKEEDKALDSRKEMVEIREEELDAKQDALDEEQKDVEAKEQIIEEQLEEKKEELEQAETGTPEEEALKEEVEQLEEEKKELEEEKKEIREEQKEIDKEQKEVAEMREEIASDENLLQQETSGTVLSSEAETEPEGFWFILVDKSAEPASFGTLWKVTKDGVLLKKSDLNSIRGTSYSESGEGVIVIAGKSEDNSLVKALILDPVNLEILKESETEIYPGSSIWTQDNNIFMISRNGQNWSVGMFSEKLELLHLSELSVHPDTGLVFVKDRVLVQSDSGEVKALMTASLKEVKISE